MELAEPTSLLTMAARAAAGRRRGDVASADQAARDGAGRTRARAPADRTRTARYLSLLPEVDAEGGYVRTDGQLFAPPNQWFVGVRASWNIWEWGASFFQARAASRQAEASRSSARTSQRQVALEVQNDDGADASGRRRRRRGAAGHRLGAEAYRVTQALVQAGSATTTDLLDAQSAFLTARLNLARAQYELAIQRVALARVTAE